MNTSLKRKPGRAETLYVHATSVVPLPVPVKALKFNDSPDSLPVLNGVKLPRTTWPDPVEIVLTAMLLNNTFPTLHETPGAAYAANWLPFKPVELETS
jgi:hypothetical protein